VAFFSEHNQRIQERRRRSGTIKAADMSSSSSSMRYWTEILRHRQTALALPRVSAEERAKDDEYASLQ